MLPKLAFRTVSDQSVLNRHFELAAGRVDPSAALRSGRDDRTKNAPGSCNRDGADRHSGGRSGTSLRRPWRGAFLPAWAPAAAPVAAPAPLRPRVRKPFSLTLRTL